MSSGRTICRAIVDAAGLCSASATPNERRRRPGSGVCGDRAEQPTGPPGRPRGRWRSPCGGCPTGRHHQVEQHRRAGQRGDRAAAPGRRRARPSGSAISQTVSRGPRGRGPRSSAPCGRAHLRCSRGERRRREEKGQGKEEGRGRTGTPQPAPAGSGSAIVVDVPPPSVPSPTPRSTPDRWVDSRGRVIDEEDRGLVSTSRRWSPAGRRSACSVRSAPARWSPGARVRRARDVDRRHHHGLRLGVGGLVLRRRRSGSAATSPRCPTRPAGRTRATARTASTSSTTPASSAPTSARPSASPDDHRRRRTPHHPAHRPRRRDRQREAGLRGLRLALRPLGRLLALRAGLEDVNYLRGVQSADDTGTVEFTSIFPACYSGRWPHVHFEVYENVANATVLRADREDLADRAAEGDLRRGVRRVAATSRASATCSRRR